MIWCLKEVLFWQMVWIYFECAGCAGRAITHEPAGLLDLVGFDIAM